MSRSTGTGTERHAVQGRNRPASQKQANRSHAGLRSLGERADAQLKSWKILREPRCGPGRAGHLCEALAVLRNHRATRTA
ncbi:hypothetical protein [Streptosporangium carneum]|uniref:hypothetical protein n=1 Tax=Streptosporangium carneum TaxID=47481 RepID=UPI003CD0C246